jgi:Co/Zn/Cd efflux system component
VSCPPGDAHRIVPACGHNPLPHGGLPWCSGLNLALVAALVIVGVTAHSLGVLAGGVDYLADAAAIAVSLFAIQLAHRPERSAAHANATNIAALVNAVRTAF